jgi:antitoxin ParD1/3/4
MNVSLTPELEAMIRQQVDSGRYNNASEVVREALRLLDEHQRVQHLRSLLAVGLEQAQPGELVEFTSELVEDIHRRAEDRFRRREEPNSGISVPEVTTAQALISTTR